MDLMDIRRVLIGGQSMLGNFSKYEKKTITFPNASGEKQWSKGAVVPCSFTPKVIVFFGGNELTGGNIYKGIFAFTIDSQDIGAGVVWANNGAGVMTIYRTQKTSSEIDAAFKYDSGVFYAMRITSGIGWSASDTYTFEIYG